MQEKPQTEHHSNTMATTHNFLASGLQVESYFLQEMDKFQQTSCEAQSPTTHV